MNELLTKSACEITQLLAEKQVRPTELVEISAKRIAQVEPLINAMPTVCIDKALERAREIENNPPDTHHVRGWLGGLPISIKDTLETAGVRTTFGSPIYADYIPPASNILVQLLESRGAIMMGKSNTPEFAAGASTFNEVFGKTRNPWDTTKSVAGSSGGACAGVATGEVWLATGSDFGGSLRTPASFNSVVGLRPSPGCVPRNHTLDPFDALHVHGPIARNTQDIALFLDAMSASHTHDPLSLPAPTNPYMHSIRNPIAPKRIAYSSDLGVTHVDPKIDAICREATGYFQHFDTIIEEKCSDFAGAIESFNVLRGASFAMNFAQEYSQNRDLLKPEIVWNIEQGMKLSADDIGQAQRTQARIFESLAEFFDQYDLLVSPCAIVEPFDVDQRYVESIGEYVFSNYFEWIAITFAITLTGCPTLALPAGFTDSGLPVGIQITAPPRGEPSLLSAGYLLEQETTIAQLLPIDPIVRHTIVP
ncbi:MAG: amidase family protein [Acidiferrobacterales bacterium]|nr:amidase family protein [Acidiferrobacterales bacterium]